MALSISGLTSGVSTSFSALQNLGVSKGVTLGGFRFKDFEVPEKVDLGAQQQMTVHKLPGGKRYIDVMGRDDADIRWDGQMIGPDAMSRVSKLGTMRDAGKAIPLSIGSINLTVVIKDINYTLRFGRIEYKIELVVAPPPKKGADTTTPGGFLSSIRQAANDVAGAIQSVEDQVNEALAPISEFVQEASSVVDPILSGLGISVPFLSALENGLGSISDVGALAAALSTASNMAALDDLLSSSQSTVASLVASSAASIDAVSANATTAGAIEASPPIMAQQAVANAPPASDGSPLVWSPTDLTAALAGLQVQSLAVQTNASITNARRDLVINGYVTAGAYPSLQAVTNDLYAAQIPSTVTLQGGQLVLALPPLQAAIQPIVSIVYTPPVTIPVVSPKAYSFSDGSMMTFSDGGTATST